MKISVKKIKTKGAYFNPCKIEGITESTEKTLSEWLDLESEKITNTDKVWLAIRFMTDLQNRIFAVWCARQRETKIKEIKDCIDAIENYYIKKTITEEQLNMTLSAIGSAVYTTTISAINSAAYKDADEAANWAAYWATFPTAGYVAERKKQVEKIKEII